jgi:hypothetical protein
MREEKALIRIFRKIAELFGEEAARNPEFAARVDSILSELPAKKKPAPKKAAVMSPTELPDVFLEWKSRGANDFTLWLRDQPLAVLRGVIKLHDLDASKRASKWKDAEKLAHFIAEQMRSRTSRGSSFLVANPPFSSQ